MHRPSSVMAGRKARSAVFAPEVPAIHVLLNRRKTWMPATSAGMTLRVWRCFTTSTHARSAESRIRRSSIPLVPAKAGTQSCETVLDPRLRGDERNVFTFQTMPCLSNSQVFQTAMHHHPYCLARPRVGPSSVLSLLPLAKRGGWRAKGRNHCSLMCPHSLSEIRGAARRATRTSLRTSGFICGVFLAAPGRAFRGRP